MKLTGREERAVELVATGSVGTIHRIEDPDGSHIEAMVQASDGRHYYHVRIFDESELSSCQCEDADLGGKRCKHQIATELKMEAERRADSL